MVAIAGLNAIFTQNVEHNSTNTLTHFRTCHLLLLVNSSSPQRRTNWTKPLTCLADRRVSDRNEKDSETVQGFT